MKYFLSGCALLLAATDATAYCSIPNAPYQGATNGQIQRYYKQLENYQYCMQQQLEQQEFDRQQQQNSQPRSGFNGGFNSGKFTY